MSEAFNNIVVIFIIHLLTLHTSIPHPQLKDNLNNFLNRIFDIKSKCFIVCNLFSKCVYFSDSNSISKSCIKFTLESLLECLNYLIDNAYIIFDGNVSVYSITI